MTPFDDALAAGDIRKASELAAALPIQQYGPAMRRVFAEFERQQFAATTHPQRSRAPC